MKKTPEEILERHTNSEDWTSGLKGDVIDAMQEYATQCQQDHAAQTSEWQLCPKCNGDGRVTSNGLTSSVYQQCDVCNGSKTLIKPLFSSQQDNAEQLIQIIDALNKLKVDSTKPDCKTLRTGDYRIGIDAAISLIETLNKQ